MSANPDVLRASELIGSAVDAKAATQKKMAREQSAWSPEAFAREQIRTLVRRVFFHCEGRPAKQVVFSAAGANPELASICHQVGEALALETPSRVAIVTREPSDRNKICFLRNDDTTRIKDDAVQLATNLWRVAELGPRGGSERTGLGQYWASRLAELRSEFEFSVIQGPVAGSSSESALLGELADGIVLVLGAGSTRKASARKVKEWLEAGSSRLLGTVLSGRAFPVPQRIYQRL
ncbi:MAG TPA: hypothetical protein VMF10_01365 [Candidatus Aquilonibacter sp.]|nr:hypothetical protein [Candidatus Aquilonibacter sp.]